MEEIMEEITVRNEIENESKAETATAAHAVSESNEETKEKDSGKPSKMKKKILWIFLTPVILILAAAIVLFVILYSRIVTAANVEQVGHNLYKVHYCQDYFLDKALEAGIKTEQELLDFINRKSPTNTRWIVFSRSTSTFYRRSSPTGR